ncbi:MAG TPA: phytanoyl-CoA dioxygenase family protein [Pyrinomonadaceae bacterium]|nr:phytanoyl-CoA dioxygenase family protein [Pyrinomonadaceae bacterium]
MVEDLSARHDLVSDFVTLPASAEEWAACCLTDEQLRFFREHGYLKGVRVLTDAQVDVLRRELDELMNPSRAARRLFYEYHSNESEDPSAVLFHALGAWRVAPGFHDLLWHPRFTVAARQLLGGAVRFWHDQLFCKPARHGGVVAWHQDYSYWTRTKPLAHLTCWIALDDSTAENGCVQYVPGSHLWPDLPKTKLASDMDAIKSVLTDEQRERFKPVAVELRRGESSFHHPRMIHGSYANRTDRPRRAAVINVVLDGVRSDSDEPLLAGVPVIPRGEPLGGRFFPLLLGTETFAC